MPDVFGWSLLAVGSGPLLVLGCAIRWPFLLPMAILLVMLMALPMRALIEARRANRRAGELLGDEDRRIGLAAKLELIAAQMDRLAHRHSPVHPISKLPTRESLVAAVQAHGDAGGGARLLALVRFADFDRIASFDQKLAQNALAELATRATGAVQRQNLITQVDRDCFAVWFAGQPDRDAALAELRTLAHLLTQELPSATTTLNPALEVGLADFPVDGTDAAALLARALTTRMRPQPAPDGTLMLSDPAPRDVARETFVLEQDLAQAIAEEQLTMLFQPLIDVARRRVIGAEALLRWHHPKLGPISPARFIPLVEAIGLSDQYGAWVLNAACREARRWRDAGLGDIRVAVNLSACQLSDPMLQKKIERTLERHHLEPRFLELELTETAAMADAGRTLRLFRDLHDLGIALALDDFGSGHSSLSYLKNLPFDKLKIDREFVIELDRQDDSRAICKALVELARGLNLRVLAEGVERPEEVAALMALGCTIFQGYFFSRPLSGADFLAFARDPSRIPMPDVDTLARQASSQRFIPA